MLSRNQKRHDQTFRWAVITAVIIVLGVAAGWWFVGKDQVVTSAVTVSPQLPAQQEVNQLAATANSFNRTTVSQSLNAPVPSEAARLASTPVATVNALAQDSGAVSSSTEQSLPLTGSDIVPATGTSAVVDRTVTTSTSMPTLNPATDSNDQPVHNPLTGAETVQTPVAGSTAINNQVAQAPAAETILAAIPDQEDVALSITPTADGAQQVTLISAGADMIQLSFKGTSWVEIDDGAKGRLYNETLNSGDVMTLHGTAPFKVLLGDAAQVDLSFNSVPINLASQIRSDKTARFSLGAAATPAVNTAAVSDANP